MFFQKPKSLLPLKEMPKKVNTKRKFLYLDEDESLVDAAGNEIFPKGSTWDQARYYLQQKATNRAIGQQIKVNHELFKKQKVENKAVTLLGDNAWAICKNHGAWNKILNKLPVKVPAKLNSQGLNRTEWVIAIDELNKATEETSTLLHDANLRKFEKERFIQQKSESKYQNANYLLFASQIYIVLTSFV
tara:strand:- start:1158 stop:1724 length:567 start_codon:yes stop_codon:yes gene_type:complete